MILIVGARKAAQKLPFFVKVTIGIELVSIGSIDIRIAIHLPYVRDDRSALGDEVTLIVVILNTAMRSECALRKHLLRQRRRKGSQSHRKYGAPPEHLLDHSAEERQVG